MPRVEFKGREGDGAWKPLPNGTYTIMVDGAEETRSSNDNPQIKVSGHVVGGAHDAKKVTIWYAATPKSLWRMEQFLEACDVDFEQIDLGTTDPENGKPEYNLVFDTDDLPGREFMCDVTEDEYQGKPTNRFSNERAPDNGKAATPSAPQQSAASGGEAAPQEQPQQQQAAAQSGGRRRRRVN